jgi:hypothetical protein
VEVVVRTLATLSDNPGFGRGYHALAAWALAARRVIWMMAASWTMAAWWAGRRS